ncbi:hypothetical protein EVAR_6757_1 [Eumeta japonica]|uniref:Uncharacterized protein n=1 Tax=Eumeta variegata TaxID=151549 RepID=A0A4C1V4A3_EUMVA|nr:hypothetical protein EVAR_6757_1 [Eumeta japonica]
MAYRGTPLLVKKDIMHESIDHTNYASMRSLGVRVSSAEVELEIFAVYRPPRSPLRVQDVHVILDDPTPMLLAGDPDAKHKANTLDLIGRARHSLPRPTRQRHWEVYQKSLETLYLGSSQATPTPTLQTLDLHPLSQIQK